MIRFVILCALLVSATFPQRNSAADLSLAIIPEDQTASAAADLLTAELSAVPNLKLLERADLQRIIAEQRLSLMQSQDLLAVGKLSGAQALLFLDHFAQTGRDDQTLAEFLGVRLILVNAGVILDTVDFSWPLSDLAQWATSTAEYLRPGFARASLPENALVKLSLLNLRSPTDSRESRMLDQELNALLLKRLARETNVLVLERQKLGATLLERELNSETSPFWRGSYLIEGSVNKFGYSTNQITLEGRVLAPGAQNTNVVQLAGKPSDLSLIIDEFVRESLKIAQSASTVSWDANAEAARYFEEAAWAARWGLLPEAQSAADAAWALGKQDEPTATLRVQSYGRAAKPRSFISYTFPQRRRLAYSEPPQAGALANGISALSIFVERSSRVSVDKATRGWLNAGHEALRHASELLTVYYYTPEARVGVEEDLAELRALCRQAAEWMSGAPLNREAFYLENPNLNFDQINQALEREHLFKTMAQFGALWHDRTSALDLHRMLINAPAFALIRTEYLGDFTQHAPVVGWTWAQRQQALPLWRDFLLEVEKGTNLVAQIEAKILRTRTLGRENERFALIREIVETIRSNTNALSQHPVLLDYEYQLVRCVPSATGLNMVTHERGKLEDELNEARKTVFEPLARSQWNFADRRKREAKSAGLFDEQKSFLAERKTDPGEFPRLFLFPDHFTREQGETLLRMLPEYRTNLSISLATAEVRNRGRIQISLMQAEQAERRIASILYNTNGTPREVSGPRTNRVVRGNPAAPGLTPGSGFPPQRPPTGPGGFAGPDGPSRPGGPTAAPGSPFPGRPFPGGRSPGAPVGPGGMAPEPFIPAAVRTNTLSISTFHAIPPRLIPTNNVQFFRATGVVADDGQVWLRTRFTLSRPENGYNSEPTGAIVGFDPARGVIDSISTPFETTPFINHYAPLVTDFHFWKGDLYAAGPAQLQRYDRGARKWNALPVPLSRNAQVISVDNRLLVLNAETILDLQEGGAGAKTLASSRRQPITPLDALTNLAEALVFKAPKGFRVWVPPTLYDFDGAAFSQLRSFANPVQTSRDPSGFLAVEGAPPRQGFSTSAYLVGPGDSTPSPIFTQLTRWFSPLYHPPNVANEPEDIRWKRMNQFGLDPTLAIVVGEDLVTWGSPLPKEMPTGRGEPESIHPAVPLDSYLFLFSKRFSEPIVINVESAAGIPNLREKNRPRGAQPSRPFLRATKTHLVLGNSEARGLWFVPLAQLSQCVEQAKAPNIAGGAQ